MTGSSVSPLMSLMRLSTPNLPMFLGDWATVASISPARIAAAASGLASKPTTMTLPSRSWRTQRLDGAERHVVVAREHAREIGVLGQDVFHRGLALGLVEVGGDLRDEVQAARRRPALCAPSARALPVDVVMTPWMMATLPPGGDVVAQVLAGERGADLVVRADEGDALIGALRVDEHDLDAGSDRGLSMDGASAAGSVGATAMPAAPWVTASSICAICAWTSDSVGGAIDRDVDAPVRACLLGARLDGRPERVAAARAPSC